MTRWLPLAMVVLAGSTLGGIAGCAPTLRDGIYACADDSECPTGFRCGSGRCRNQSGTECRQDIECEDGSACTEDLCENGYCGHAMAAGSDGAYCDDGTFCNGSDECRGGRCTNVGPPPCATCDEVSRGCNDCGQLGTSCCPGNLCFDGNCNGGICEACGQRDQACCAAFPGCGPGLTCDGSSGALTCRTCGGDGEPCCFGAIGGDSCNTGLECDFMSSRCGACGDLGQLCCQRGCVADLVCDVDTDGVSRCVAVSCPSSCPEGSICAPVSGGATCKQCGTEMDLCCSGGTCPGTPGGACYYGRCASVFPG